MSHFPVLVILDKKQALHIERSLELLLEPYNENRAMPKHRRYIEGSSLELMKKHYGTDDLTRLAANMGHWTGNAGGVADGKLFELSSYNENSKWDWYQIGGRWSGSLSGYEPRTDPKNQETCDLCGGTGKRKDFAESEMTWCGGCNGCHGKGVRTKWPTQWATFAGDVQPMAAVKDFVPFAVVTPQGEWIERGSMGWWGMVRNDQPDEAWEAVARGAMKRFTNSDHVGVVVDCHI